MIIVGRAKQITSYLKRFDDKLFCDKNAVGKLCVYRKDYVVDWYEFEGRALGVVRLAPHLVFALTDNWKENGKPVYWSLDSIYFRVRQLDLWNRDIAKESIESIERANQSVERTVDNHIESFLIENRREFARRTNDINTSTLNKRIGVH